MQAFLKNPIFQIVKCILYGGLTYMEEKLLACDHNTDIDYRKSMTFIQRVIFIYNEFEQIYAGDRLKAYAYFQKQCCVEIGFPIKEDDAKHKCLKGSDAFRDVDYYFQLTFRMGSIGI